MKKEKRINNLRKFGIVFLNILVLISLYIVLAKQNEFGYRLYWVVVPFLMVLILSLIQRWSVRGLNADIDESKVIQRSFDDLTTLSTVFYGLIYLIIMFVEQIKENITHNPFIIIGFFIVMLVYELFTYLAISNAKRDTAKLLEKKYNKK